MKDQGNEGRRVLITGGARGIGGALAEALAAEGDAVVVTSRQAEGVPEPVPGGVDTARLDVCREAEVEGLFGSLREEWPRLDAIVINAGVGSFEPLAELTTARFREVIETNLIGAFTCARLAFEWMAETGGGRVLVVGSVADAQPFPDCVAYGASKYGLRGLSENLVIEGRPLGIRVTHVSLGAVWTDMWVGREGFDRSKMLTAEAVATTMASLLRQPLEVAVEHVKIMPPAGTL